MRGRDKRKAKAARASAEADGAAGPPGNRLVTDYGAPSRAAAATHCEPSACRCYHAPRPPCTLAVRHPAAYSAQKPTNTPMCRP
eukprot:5491587-Prymnesium_polylepis.1